MRYCPLEESNVPSARGCSQRELHSASKRNNPMKHIGPVISGVVLASLLIDLLLEHTVLQPKTQLLEQVGIITHADR